MGVAACGFRLAEIFFLLHHVEPSTMIGNEVSPNVALSTETPLSINRDARSLRAAARTAKDQTGARTTSDENAHLNYGSNVNQQPDRRSNFCHAISLPQKVSLHRRASIGIEHQRSPLAGVDITTTRGVEQGKPTAVFSAPNTTSSTHSFGTIKRSKNLIVSSCKRSWHSLGSASGASLESTPPCRQRSSPSSVFPTARSRGSVATAMYYESASFLDRLRLSSLASANTVAPSLSTAQRQAPWLPTHQESSRLSSVAVNPTADQDHSRFLAYPSFEQVEAIRKSVRAYTLLPKHARPLDCAPALAIYTLTGYVIVSPVVALSPSPSTSMNDSAQGQGTLDSPNLMKRDKADVIQDLGGEELLRELNACKLLDASFALQATQCRPEKDRGFYRYIHIPTSSVVTPEIYEERYMQMLSETCAIKEQHWQSYFDYLKQLECVQDLHMLINSTSCIFPLSRRSSHHSNVKIRVPSQSPRKNVLSLTLHDETSSDPEVEAAEDELHEKIDAALSEYSHKMIAIQNRRRRILGQTS